MTQTYLAQWAALAMAFGELLGLWCFAQGHLCCDLATLRIEPATIRSQVLAWITRFSNQKWIFFKQYQLQNK